MSKVLEKFLVFVEAIHQQVWRINKVDAIYSDFRKAFDSVPHLKLLYKLEKSGITGNLRRWLQAYITGRLQCTLINNYKSDIIAVVPGVPESSMLGPLLFILNLNDLPSSISYSRMLSFADDTKCFKSTQKAANVHAL